MFGLMPIECAWDDRACLSGGGGYILGAGDVFNNPYRYTYGFTPPPPMQPLPLTGYILPYVNNNNGMPAVATIGPGEVLNNPITANQIVNNLTQTASTHSLLVLAAIALGIYIITK